jgi:hypothetical protein
MLCKEALHEVLSEACMSSIQTCIQPRRAQSHATQSLAALATQPKERIFSSGVVLKSDLMC